MEQDQTVDTAAPPFTSDAPGLADASFKIEDVHIDERERISYTKERILQIREDIEISEDILKVNQLIEAEFDDTKSEDLHFQGRERICYSIDQLLRLQEVAKVSEGILKIKKEFDDEIKASASPSFSDLSGSPPETDNLVQQRAQMDNCTWGRGQSECTYFTKFGTCKFGSTCKYKHTQSSATTESSLADGPIQRPTHMDYTERRHQSDCLSPGKPVCSYFIKYGTCKFESACIYRHPSPSALTYLTTKADGFTHHEGQLDEYPQRPGEPECSYFIKHGTCKFRYSCKFHHPAPSTPSGLTVKIDDLDHWEQMEEYPQRPGEPECSYFIRYGTCKFRYSCKFHHPSPTTLGGLTTEANDWVRHQRHSEISGEADCQPTVPLCIISPAGLPLRPGQPSCSYYSRFGSCKFGLQCRFDHPMDNASSVPAADSKHCQG